MYVLVTGGAGYVGSHVVRLLLDSGLQVTVLDDLSTGNRRAVPTETRLIVGRCGDRASLQSACEPRAPDGVMHLAARCSVDESMQHPELYYHTNLIESLALLDWMVERRIGWLIHSSTCAVYGVPERLPIDEQTCPRPISAYGASKLSVDQALGFYRQAYGIRSVSLRYFNAAGAHPSGDLGDSKRAPTNLIPIICNVALGAQEQLEVYGTDYPSDDGTAVRDYVHVDDLAAAHLRALQRLSNGDNGGIYNLGSGSGHTVLEVVDRARSVIGHALPVQFHPRRTGDPPALVAAAELARRELGWEPQRSEIDVILADAWRWHQRHPHGFDD